MYQEEYRLETSEAESVAFEIGDIFLQNPDVWITGRDLQGYVKGATSGAQVREAIHFLRVNGLAPTIISSQKGYKLTTERDEIMRYLISLRHRISEIRSVVTAIESDLPVDEYQLRLVEL